MANPTTPPDPPLRVLWHSRLAADLAAEADWPETLDVRVALDPEEAAAQVDEAQVLVHGDPDDRLLDGARLRHVIVPYAGIRAELRDRLRARPQLTLHNSHFNDAFVAQHGTALLLACANGVPAFDRRLREGDWSDRSGPESVHLAGRRALLVGFGAIARAWLPHLRGLGMEVRAVRRRPDPDGDPPQVGMDALADELGRAQAVLVSLPHTPATEGLFDDAAFEAMAPGALFVNVGRGATVDPWALHRALASGRLAGAGLDVWWNYPDGEEARRDTRPADPPLEAHEGLVMSPHRANQVADWQRASLHDVRASLERLARGDLDRNRVDPERGY